MEGFNILMWFGIALLAFWCFASFVYGTHVLEYVYAPPSPWPPGNLFQLLSIINPCFWISWFLFYPWNGP